MTITFPKIEFGNATNSSRVSAFPLFVDVDNQVEYQLADEAIADNGIVVEEIDEAGSVPEVIAKNQGDQRVLFLEGQELVGAKQNRIVNTSILIPPRSEVRIPVCCVEQNRWQYKSSVFSHEGRHASSRLRSVLKRTVASSIQDGHGHRADQNEIWREVSGVQVQLGIQSTTRALSDTYESCDWIIEEAAKILPHIEGAAGLALTVDCQFVSIDLFDRPATCKNVWPGLVRACAVDAVGIMSASPQLAEISIQQCLDLMKTTSWTASPTIGEGQEYRCNIPKRFHASALVLDASLIHASLCPHR